MFFTKFTNYLQKFTEFLYSFFVKISRNQIEKSAKHQVLFLLFLISIIILIFGSLFALFDLHHDLGNPYWFAIVSLLGPDGLFELEDENFTIKFLSFLLSILGLVIFNGIIIAIVVSNLQKYFEEIRNGSGPIDAKNPIFLCGWSSSIPTLLKEMDFYAESENTHLQIVLMTEKIMPEIKNEIGSFKNISFFYRTGSLFSQKDLKRLAFHKAKSIVLFYDNKEGKSNLKSEDYDSRIIKHYLHIKEIFRNSLEPPKIILNFSEISNSQYISHEKLKSTIFLNSYFYSAKFISLLLKNTNHYSILNEILSFKGNEFHFVNSKEFFGKTIREIFRISKNFIPVGIWRNSELFLIPDLDLLLKEGDELIVFSENSQNLENFSHPEISTNNNLFINLKEVKNQPIKNVLILGINPRLPYILEELNKENSNVYLYGTVSKEELFQWIRSREYLKSLNKLKYTQITPDLERNFHLKLNLTKMDKVLVLSDEGSFDYNFRHSLDENTLIRILKILNLKKSQDLICKFDLICEVKEPETEKIMKSLLSDQGHYIIGTSIVAKIINMNLVHGGYFKLFNELLQIGNVDLQVLTMEGILPGLTNFKELSVYFYEEKESILLGIIKKNGEILLNPSADLIVEDKDQLVCLRHSDISIFSSHF